MTLIKMNFVLLICFSVLFVYVQGKSESAKKSEIGPSVEIIDGKQNKGGIKESGNVENEKKEKVEANVKEGKGEKEGETVSGENGKNSTEGKDEDDGKIKVNENIGNMKITKMNNLRISMKLLRRIEKS